MAIDKESYHSFRCPICRGIGYIDQEQHDGKVSIVCSHCNWHGYREEEEAECWCPDSYLENGIPIEHCPRHDSKKEDAVDKDPVQNRHES